MTQLELAIEAVFKSWMGRRAVDYRREFKSLLTSPMGQRSMSVTMVFGNMEPIRPQAWLSREIQEVGKSFLW